MPRRTVKLLGLSLFTTLVVGFGGYAVHAELAPPPESSSASPESAEVAPPGETDPPRQVVKPDPSEVRHYSYKAEGLGVGLQGAKLGEPSGSKRKQDARDARRLQKMEDKAAELATHTDGPLGKLFFSKSPAVEGTISTATANIPARTSTAGWSSDLRRLVAPGPDFVTLNEVATRPTSGIQALAPGYGVVRGEQDYSPGARAQALNNVVLYREDHWTVLASGMERVVNDDRPVFGGSNPLWDRFATWAVMSNKQGEIVSVISLHMPTNPGKYPAQWGRNAQSRVALYSEGMDRVLAIVDQLSAYGPVIVAGDMNSHAPQGAWTAAQKMATRGYSYTRDNGVMHFFYKAPATVTETHFFTIDSDHPALSTTIELNGWGAE